jgi:hypothetical protein
MFETFWVSIYFIQIPFDGGSITPTSYRLVCLRSSTSPSGDRHIYYFPDVVFSPRTANRVTAHTLPEP